MVWVIRHRISHTPYTVQGQAAISAILQVNTSQIPIPNEAGPNPILPAAFHHMAA
jgi:hypothetical protein